MASKSSRVSRRRLLKTAGAAAFGGGTAAFLGGGAAQAQAPAILTNTQRGRKFRAFVKFNNDLPTIQDVTARALTARQVLIRTEAAQTCYSSIDQVLLPSPTQQAVIVGHGGVGIVEAVGPQAYRVQVGDRVIVNFHTACGSCFNCLWMRADKCLNRGAATAIPTCDMADGRPVYSGNSGMSELMIVHEEQAVPLFTDRSPVEIAILHCVGNCGLGMTMTNCPVEAGTDVVIFGAGPVGLSAVQGARIKGASRIIVVEPVPYRRQLALQLGATAVVDPNQYRDRQPIRGAAGNTDHFRDSLVEHLREMTKKKTDRRFAGGGTVGPDHVIEAVGGDRIKPKTEQGPDPTGVTALNQCWELCSSIGTLVTCSVGHPADAMVQIPASQWADGAKHHWPGTAGGTNPRRDVPRYITMMETGQLNMKALASSTYPLARAREAYQAAADRLVVATIVTPNAT
jgi:S-(hydroxymethyl)glutathione dehydrogenase/alcohol dehydrogenase